MKECRVTEPQQVKKCRWWWRTGAAADVGMAKVMQDYGLEEMENTRNVAGLGEGVAALSVPQAFYHRAWVRGGSDVKKIPC